MPDFKPHEKLVMDSLAEMHLAYDGAFPDKAEEFQEALNALFDGWVWNQMEDSSNERRLQYEEYLHGRIKSIVLSRNVETDLLEDR